MNIKKPSLYQQLLGPAFETMAPELRAFHSLRGDHRLSGSCVVTGAETFLGKMIAFLMRLPRENSGCPLTFSLRADEQKEIWVRHFPLRTMKSVMRIDKGALVEQLGPATVYFALKSNRHKLKMKVRRVQLFGRAVPRFLFPDITAEETGEEGKLHFHVAVRVPCVGLLVAYRGSLAVHQNMI